MKKLFYFLIIQFFLFTNSIAEDINISHEQFLQHYFNAPQAQSFIDSYITAIFRFTRDEDKAILMEEFKPKFYAGYRKGYSIKSSFGNNDLNCTTIYETRYVNCYIDSVKLVWDWLPKNKGVVYLTEFQTHLQQHPPKATLNAFNDALFTAMTNGIVEISGLGTFKYTSTGNVSFRAQADLDYRLGEVESPAHDFCNEGEVPIEVPEYFLESWKPTSGCALLDSDGKLVIPNDAMFCIDKNFYGFSVRPLNKNKGYQTTCAVPGTFINGFAVNLVDVLLPAEVNPHQPPASLEVDYCGYIIPTAIFK